MKIALLTSEKEYNKNNDDLLLLENLNSKAGVSCYHCIWNDPLIKWEKFDKIVLRTPWDYSQNFDQFFEFVNEPIIQNKVINSIEVINWNINKTYLKKLDGIGIPVIETEYVPDWNFSKILQAINSFESEKIILKPSISAGGRAVFLLENKNDINEVLKGIPKVGELMVQPFKDEIFNGEFSAIIIDNKLYHTVIKKPSENGFKVQSHFGGTEVLYSINPINKEFCENVLNSIGYKIHYGRIDYIVEKGNPKLMELELFEPDLFLRECNKALNQFCEMIIKADNTQYIKLGK